jgi:amidase
MPIESFTTVQLAAHIRSRNVSPVEVVDALLARIERVNPKVNAIITLDAEAARTRAEAAEEALMRDELWGPLHGVPFSLKDCHSTAGMRTTVGHPSFAEYVPAEDGTVAARCKAAGGILLGKTNVPPMLMRAQTQNELFGRTNNPFDLTRTAGGSSGGSAAAVAAKLVPFDIGSDMSGSIRIPSHFCGVFGFKPTAHRVPLTGHIPPLPGVPPPERLLPHIGPIARSAEDLALLGEVLAGPDGRDIHVPPVPWRALPELRISTLKIAYQSSFVGVPTAAAIVARVDRLAAELAGAGAHVEERMPGFSVEQLNAVWRDYFALLARVIAELGGPKLPVAPPEGLQPTLGNWTRVLARHEELVSAVDSVLRQFDAFLCPASITTAFPHSRPGTPIPVDGVAVESRYIDHYLYPFNFTGCPCVVIPAGLSEEGLPIGVQLVGRRWSDEHLLGVARTLSELTGGYREPTQLDTQPAGFHEL